MKQIEEKELTRIAGECEITQSEPNVTVFNTILTYIVSECDVEIKEINGECILRDDLNVNSLDVVHIICEIERKHLHYIPDDVSYDLSVNLKEFTSKVMLHVY